MRKIAHWLIRKLADRYGFGMTRAEIERRILFQDEYWPHIKRIEYSCSDTPETFDQYAFLKPGGPPLCSTKHPLDVEPFAPREGAE